METNFSLAQLADPRTAEAEKILRACVHCGFCTATCPTYVTLGDERDSPRGRIYMIKSMLETGAAPGQEITRHIDRCLSCLSCVTTCPSGVDYMHLVDHARVKIEAAGKRPAGVRALRRLLAAVLPYPARFRAALVLALAAKPAVPLLERLGFARMAAMLRLAPGNPLRRATYTAGAMAQGPRRARVALLAGCAQTVLRPAINDATIRLLSRAGVEVVVPPAAGCCGSLAHHLGREGEAIAAARRNILAWESVIADGGLDAILINTSGCGTVVKDYGHMLAHDMEWSARAAHISSLTRDVTEFAAELGLPTAVGWSDIRVAYHSACSMQHGQRIITEPRQLLREAGFAVVEVPEGHLCCGSAGVYNILQPAIAQELQARKRDNIAKTRADCVATGNIGCITQIAGEGPPVVHTVELLDWAQGGPVPAELAHLAGRLQPTAQRLAARTSAGPRPLPQKIA